MFIFKIFGTKIRLLSEITKYIIKKTRKTSIFFNTSYPRLVISQIIPQNIIQLSSI